MRFVLRFFVLLILATALGMTQSQKTFNKLYTDISVIFYENMKD